MNFNENLKISVTPNAKQTKLVNDSKDNKIYKFFVKAPPEKNKANIEIVKYFTKLSKKKVKIIKGLKSREKILKFY
jgi:hypothetical protein